MTKKGFISVGSEVTYCGCWGTKSPTTAKVKSIERTMEENGKYGTPVSKISIDDLSHAIFDLSDGHWCYGYQIVI